MRYQYEKLSLNFAANWSKETSFEFKNALLKNCCQDKTDKGTLFEVVNQAAARSTATFKCAETCQFAY